EGDVLIVAPRDVEAVGLAETGRIAVRSGETEQHALPFPNPFAADLQVPARPPEDRLDRRVVPKQLLDRGWRERRVRSQPLELLGVANKREQPVRDQIRRRLVTREEEQRAGADDLVEVEQPAPIVRGDERADQIVPWRLPAHEYD